MISSKSGVYADELRHNVSVDTELGDMLESLKNLSMAISDKIESYSHKSYYESVANTASFMAKKYNGEN